MKYFFSFLLLVVFSSFVSAKGKYKETTVTTESSFIYDACLSENGKVIICTDNTSLKAFSVETKNLINSFTGGHRGKVLCVALSPDSTMLASGGSDSTVVLWDYNTHAIIQKITFATGKITSIKFSPDNQYILFGCSNSPAYLYNIKEQKKINEFTDQKMDVTSVAFSSNGSMIAIAGGDRIIRLYNSADFQLKSELKGHTNWVRSICFYNNGQNLISCGDDKKIIQWNLTKHNNIISNSHKGWILSIEIENYDIHKSNIYVFGTINGSVIIKYSFGYFTARLNSPVSKILLLPDKNGVIEIAAATLGSGFMFFNSVNMDVSE